MEFENDNSQANSAPCFKSHDYSTPEHSQYYYTVPPNTGYSVQMTNFQHPFCQQPQFFQQGQNLFQNMQQPIQPPTNNLFSQSPQITTQQYFPQPVQQQQQEQDDDQDYQPSEEESSSSEEEVEELQEEEQFDDPDFDLQAYLKVRDQL